MTTDHSFSRFTVAFLGSPAINNDFLLRAMKIHLPDGTTLVTIQPSLMSFRGSFLL